MTGSAYGELEKLESDLWEAADQLRANSKLTSSEYCMPVLGVIFLRHATNRFEVAHTDIEAERVAGRMKRKPRPEDYVRRRALFLPEIARYDYIIGQSKDRPLPQLLNEAMKAIEESFELLTNVLPKDYHIFTDQTVLEELLKIFNREALKTASGDIFGRIYEYFLMKFAIDKAMDNGEFFTPPSIVQTIVNVIEPDHGTVADIACGSGGMFVQSSYFIESEGEDTAKRVTFYGHEKTASTIKLAKMNLAVHGLEGQIAEANTFYEDPFTLAGQCDFVMANPPFNVDMVDAKKVEADKKRLPFGLPGVNKAGKVSNGNYLWISYFHSYLKDSGRAGFVMSSQASSAGRDEQTVRRKIIETGAVDVMIAIRSNFFYTRSVPCELWFIDKGKPDAPVPPCQPSPPAPLPAGEGSRKANYRGGYDFSGLVERARELRQKQTPAEELLWELLRSRRFMGLKFRRQHQVGDYLVDFYCHDRRLVVEIDGSVHDEHRQAKKDKARQHYLESLGNTVVRFRNERVLDDSRGVLSNLAQAIASADAILPSPAGRGAGGEGAVPLNTRDHVLMIDARSIYRKVTRKVNDFSAEQLANLSAIVWLYRGESKRFVELARQHLEHAVTEAAGIAEAVEAFEATSDALTDATAAYLKSLPKKHPLHAIAKERDEAARQCFASAASLTAAIAKRWSSAPKATLAAVKQSADGMDELARSCRDVVKDIDMLAKLSGQVAREVLGGPTWQAPSPQPSPSGRGRAAGAETDPPSPAGRGDGGEGYAAVDKQEIRRQLKNLENLRTGAVERLRTAAYYHRHAQWLLSRFPDAKLVDVPGLVKLVDRAEIEAADWSLTPGRYVGVAPPEPDEDFDFEQTMRDIHVELADLNKEAVELAGRIQANFEELGI
jgi:type I restriction-modification system DNA methylase subunit/very-short-patch-repair endonuclease